MTPSGKFGLGRTKRERSDTVNKVVVTGANGKAGKVAVERLMSEGYQVVSVDLVNPRVRGTRNLTVDLTNLGPVFQTLAGADYLVHLAAIVGDDTHAPGEIFRNNALSTYNLFAAACEMGVKRVVWASSETLLGLPFNNGQPPMYVPVDEGHAPLPTTHYGLSKAVCEEMARHFSRWHDVPFIGLRYSNILSDEDYDNLFDAQEDFSLRKWNLWSYIDVRDVAESCVNALNASVTGPREYIIAAADTVMSAPTEELLDACFPEVPITRPLSSYESLFSIKKAREELGFEARHTWRA